MARYRAGLKTRERILTAARQLLSEAGLDGTTVQAICDRAGVQAGSFYNLFDSKEQVIFTVVGEAISAVDPHPDGEGKDSVAELVDAYVRFITGQPALARIYLQLAVSGGLSDDGLRQRVLSHHRRRLERFADAIRRGDDSPDWNEARARAEAMLATLNGLALLWVLDPDTDFPGHARHLLEADALTG